MTCVRAHSVSRQLEVARHTTFIQYILTNVRTVLMTSSHSVRYSVINVVQVESVSLICCRNPWAQGEWTGKYSDKNRYGEWTPELKRACNWTASKLLEPTNPQAFISFKDPADGVPRLSRTSVLGVRSTNSHQWSSLKLI